ncbi:hypothetical protein N9H69_00125 [Flavobacteriaceae bacterium]|nr:hypothetical protein [Flavobacteriaceae bacterium]
MRNFYILFIFLSLIQSAVSQTVNDITYFLGSELNGSARYNSMAGAFGALGGDLSAISINPAGSSVFLHSELGGTFTYNNKSVEGSYFGKSLNKENSNLKFDQIGAVFVFNNADTESVWTRVSAGFNSHRVSKFDQNSRVNGSNTNGIDNYFLHFADGLAFENLPLYEEESIPEVYRVLGEENGFAAQQAFLGYQAYLINPFNFIDGETRYYSNIDYTKVDHELEILSKGLHRKTALNFSALYKGVLHLGANLNFHKLEYHSDQNFFESNQNPDSPVYNIEFMNGISSFGEGISAQIGAILKLKKLRLGLTYDSPQYIEIIDETKQSLSSVYLDQGSVIKETVDPNILNTYDPYQIKLPSKTTLSAAYIFGGSGLISLDYSTQNAANTVLSRQGGSGYLDDLSNFLPSTFESIQTLKIGGEYRFKDISLRAGFLNRNNTQKSINSSDQAITFGVGLDFGSNSLSLSFVQLNENKEFQIFSEGLTDPYTLSNSITQVSLSYNIKL